MCKFFFISDFINKEISQNLINYFKSYDFKILGNDPSNSYWDSHVLRYENMPICKEKNILKNILNHRFKWCFYQNMPILKSGRRTPDGEKHF